MTLQPNQQLEISVDTRKLPDPDRAFYANAFQADRVDGVSSFSFTQLVPGAGQVQATVCIEVPDISLVMLVSSFGILRPTIEAGTFGTVRPYPSAFGTPTSSMTHPAHIVKLMLNTFQSILDFYELVPTIQTGIEVVPVIRIKAFPAILVSFVERCDEFARGVEK